MWELGKRRQKSRKDLFSRGCGIRDFVTRGVSGISGGFPASASDLFFFFFSSL